jgi:hypothetical protein
MLRQKTYCAIFALFKLKLKTNERQQNTYHDKTGGF